MAVFRPSRHWSRPSSWSITHQTNPEVDALAAIPVFDMAARIKAHGH
ncbi:hypothetical protein THIX_60249 [Thiomonas sp. X19]|nr:hypothetical protein THIX_60249 [Thiomonas sp. X19]